MASPTRTCSDCGRTDVPLQITISDSNHNKGRGFYACNNDNPAMPKGACKFFRWARSSTSVSPPNSQPITDDSSMSVLVPAPTPANQLTTTGEVTCAHPGCQTTRLAPGCKRKRCRKHCRLLGGCDGVGTHTLKVAAGGTSASVPNASEDNFFSSQGYGPPPPPAPGLSQASTSALAPLSPSLSQFTNNALRSLDARPDPRYSSQMADVFSEQWGVQQGLSASRRAREAEQLENTRKAKTEVTVHAQIMNNEDPVVSEIQDGFIHPYFKLTASMLVDIGFNAGTKLLLLRNPRFGTFARVKVDHVITVKEGDHIFLKALGITDCTVFNQQCELFGSKAAEPVHLRNNLPRERAHVRDAILAHKLQNIPQPANSRLSSQHHFHETKASTSRSMAKLLGPDMAIDISSSDDSDHAVRGHKRKRNDTTFRRVVRPFNPMDLPDELSSRPSTSASSSSTSQMAISDTSSTPSSVVVKQEPEDVLSLRMLSGRGCTSQNAIELDDADDGCYTEDGEADGDSSYHNGSGHEDDEDVEVSKIWPGEFHAVDIVNGFLAIDKMMALGTTIEAAFSFHFKGVRYVKTTYNDHLRRWQHASQRGKDEALAAGRSRNGLWSVFMMNNCAPYAERKAAKKRLRNATMIERGSSPL